MSIKLQVQILVPDEEPKEFDLHFDHQQILIGRDKDCEVHLALSSVSRKHARIARVEGAWFLEDLASRHGTRLNRAPLESGGRKSLSDGDVIEISPAKMRVQIESDTEILNTDDEKTAVVAKRLLQKGRDSKAAFDVPYLLVLNGQREGERFDLSSDVKELVVGRGESSEFHLRDPGVSRRHVLIRRNWDEVWIEDLGSRNGVFVSGRRVDAPFRLRDGNEIQLGAVRLAFVDPSAQIFNKLAQLPIFDEKPDDDGKTVVQKLRTESLEEKTASKKINVPQTLNAHPKEAAKSPIKGKGIEVALLIFAGLLLVGLVAGVVSVLL